MKVDQTRELVQLYVDEKKKVLDDFPINDVVMIADRIWQTYQNGKTVYACGNGGNAAYVANLVCDFANHPFVSDDKSKAMPSGIPRFRTVDLVSSGATLTGIMNDLGAGEIFAQQLINDKITQGDIVIGISGSGNSGNVLKAFEVAKSNGAHTIALCRGSGGKSKGLADHCLVVPGTSQFPGQVGGNDNNFHFEDAMSSIVHIITGIMRQRVTDTYGEKKSE